MIDLHSHILPGIDDGAQFEDDTIELARQAVAESITTIVATPHHQDGRFINNKNEIIKAVNRVNHRLIEEQIDLKVLAGQECRLYGEILEDYQKGEILTVNESKYLFIEFPASFVPRYTKKLFYDMQLKGIIPVIVHPERNRELMEKPEKVYEFVNNGALTQITAGSVVGRFGKKVQTFTEELIEANLAHFIASDAHNMRNRSFHMRAAYDRLQQEYGEDMVYYFRENAELAIADKHVMVEAPQTIHRRRKILGLF